MHQEGWVIQKLLNLSEPSLPSMKEKNISFADFLGEIK